MADRWPRAMREEDAAEYVGLSSTTIRAALARGDFPAPVYLTAKRIIWLREDLDAYLDRKAGRTPECGADAWMNA